MTQQFPPAARTGSWNGLLWFGDPIQEGNLTWDPVSKVLQFSDGTDIVKVGPAPKAITRRFTDDQIKASYTTPLRLIDPLPSGVGALPLGVWWMFESAAGAYVGDGDLILSNLDGDITVVDYYTSIPARIPNADIIGGSRWEDGFSLCLAQSLGGQDPPGILDSSGWVLRNDDVDFTGGHPSNFMKATIWWVEVPVH